MTLREALERLVDAAEVYGADQSTQPDRRLGAVQPITVAEGNELNAALAQARDALSTPEDRSAEREAFVAGAKFTPLSGRPELWIEQVKADALRRYPDGEVRRESK